MHRMYYEFGVQYALNSNRMQSGMTPKIKNEIYETLILYSVLFLPAYLQSGRPLDLNMFDSVQNNLFYLSIAVPQIFLLIFITSKKEYDCGFAPFKFSDLLPAAVLFLFLWITVYLLYLIFPFFPDHWLGTPIEEQWHISSSEMLPLLFVVGIATGYLEEGFFRGYLYEQTRMLGLSKLPSVIGISLLFGLGHFYQGIPGVITTTAMGALLLTFRICCKTSVHPLAIGHGLYNFSVFVFAVFSG